MTPTQQLVLAILGTLIAAAGVASPFLIAARNKRDRKIELLETKNELLEKTNHRLELQNLELRVTGVAVNKLLRQLPGPDEDGE